MSRWTIEITQLTVIYFSFMHLCASKCVYLLSLQIVKQVKDCGSRLFTSSSAVKRSPVILILDKVRGVLVAMPCYVHLHQSYTVVGRMEIDCCVLHCWILK